MQEVFARIRSYPFEKHRHALSDADAKSRGIIRAELRVNGELVQAVFLPGHR